MATGWSLSARSVKASNGNGGIEVLSPEGSSVYITEVEDQGTNGLHDNCSHLHGNQITQQQNTLIGIPRKSGTSQSVPSLVTGSLEVSKQLEELQIEGGEQSDEEILLEAGVKLKMGELQLTDGGMAPLELVSQFLACVMNEEFEAAKILCEKILEFEPSNATAREFHPLILERLKIDAELSSESSSDSSSSESDGTSSSDESSSDQEERTNHHHHNCAVSHT